MPLRAFSRPGLFAVLLALGVGACGNDSLDVASLPPGAAVREQPRQAGPGSARPIRIGEYTLTPVATYSVRGLVLDTRSYRVGREAVLSPLDFTLGWGVMSDPATLANWEVVTRGRWFRARSTVPGVRFRDIAPFLANTHLIPADPDVGDRLKRIRPGAVVELEGLLVDVAAPDGWRWRSSRSRTDTGSGACELLYVTDVRTEAAAGTTRVDG